MNKKLIAGMTSAAVIASLSAPAFAANFTDVKGTSAESAAGLLKALGIVNGDVNGNYNPNATITRAEFAKIAVRVAGLGAAADAYGTGAATGFNDVPAGHWAAGYVAVAKAAGLVKGYDAWNFGPTDNVRYEDVLTVVERILGYNDNLPGGYSAGYVVKGSALGLTKNTQFAVGKAATRGDVAVIAKGALTSDVVTYSKDTNSFTDTTVPLLDSKFSNSSDKDVLSETFNTVGTSLKTGQVKVGNKVYTTNADSIVVGGSLDALVGHSVTVVADSDLNASYIADASVAANIVTGTLNVTTTPVTVSGSVYQVSVDGTKYNLASNPVFFYNGDNVDSVAGLNATGAVDADSATIVLDKSGNAQFVGVKHYNAPKIATADSVAKTDTNDAYVAVSGGNAYVVDSTVITLNGQPATVADIKKGDVLYWTLSTVNSKNGHQYATNLDVYRTSKTGTLQSYGADGTSVKSVTVDGVTYTVNSTNFPINVTDLPALNTSVTVTLDKNGKVAAVATAASTAVASTYFVEKVDNAVYQLIDNKVVQSTQLTLMGTDGKAVTKFVAKKSDGTEAVALTNSAQGSVYAITFDVNGNVSAASLRDTVGSRTKGSGVQLGTNDVSASANTIKVGGITYNVTAQTLFVDDSNSDLTKANSLTFDKIKSGQTVRVVVDPKNVGTVIAVIVDNGATISDALSRQSGIYVGKYSTTTDGTNYTNYVTLYANGANQDFKVDSAASSATVGELVYLADVVAGGNGTYDATVNPSTTVTSVANDVYMTNGFTATGGSGKFVYTNNTKVYVEKGGVYSVSTLGDFTQYLSNNAFAPRMTLTTTGTIVGGYEVVDAVILHRP